MDIVCTLGSVHPLKHITYYTFPTTHQSFAEMWRHHLVGLTGSMMLLFFLLTSQLTTTLGGTMWSGFGTEGLPGMLLQKTKDVFDDFYNDITDEIQFRKSSVEDYQKKISDRVTSSIDRFRNDQLRVKTRAEQDLEAYMKKLNQLYTENLLSLGKQQKAIQDLSKRKIIQRPAKMDDSLEQFRKFYDESVIMSPYHVAKSTWEASWDWMSSFSLVKAQKGASDDVQIEKRIEKQIATLTQRMQQGMQDVVETASENAESLERAFRTAAIDLRKVPEDILNNARNLATSSQSSIKKTIDKSDVRRETRDLEIKLQELSREGAQWMEEKLQMVETSYKLLQDTLQQRNMEFEEMITKRRSSMQYSAMNDATLNQILKLIDPAEKGWKLIKSEDGYEVYRKMLGYGPSSQYACVMCHGIINSPPKAVLSLFEDNDRVGEYNSFCKQIIDLEYIGDDTKVVWVGSPPIFPFKPRDFCTVVHIRKLKDGTMVVLNRAIKHPKAPETSQYQRAAIVQAANIIQPVPGSSTKSKLTMITQVDPGGFAPPVIVNHICTLGPIGFMKNVEIAARKKPKFRWGRKSPTKKMQMV